MTIQSSTSRVTYAGDNVSTVFAVPFLFFATTDISVVKTAVGGAVTTLTLNADYTLTGAGNASGGTLTKTTALLTGETLGIFLDPPRTQLSHYLTNDLFPAATLETNLDREVQISQRLYDLISRSLRAPDSDNNPQLLLPSATLRALKYLTFDASGNISLAATLPSGTLSRASIGAFLYPQTTTEAAALVTPTDYGYPPLDPRRYSTIAQWSSVYNAVGPLANSYDNWYRSDHAQHPSQTNAIVGWKSYDDSLKSGTVGYRCTAFGAQALQLNGASVSAGGTNTAFGWACLQNNIEGSGNSAFGPLALQSLTGINSSHNNAFGYRALTLLVNGTQNEVFGFQGVNSLVTGDNNHAFGENVLQALTLGYGNHHFGYQAGFNKGIGDFSHAFGYQALTQESQGTITAITKAVSAVVTINTVSVNHPFAVNCPVSFEGVGGMTQINTLLGSISAVGGVSGAWTITVNINSSGFSTFTSGGAIFPLGNSAFGYKAGAALNCGGANTLIGWQAGQVNPVDVGNTIVGYQAGLNLSVGGSLNVAIGYQSLVNCLGGLNNCCMGFSSGSGITTGQQNICIGDSAGLGISTASTNVAIGSSTMTNLNGASNTAVGFNAGTQGSAQTFTNTASLGNSATPTASNQVTLGNASIATLRCQQTSITALSDIRFKQNIETLDLPDAFLDEVQIVAFDWIADDMAHHGRQVGVIAQQLDALQEKYSLQWLGLVDKSNPDQWEATPGKLLFPLLVRAQKQEARLKAIEAKLGL